MGPEVARHDNWIFNFSSAVEGADIGDIPVPSTFHTLPLNLHVTSMLKSNVPSWSKVIPVWSGEQPASGMIANSVGGLGSLNCIDFRAIGDKIVARAEPGIRRLGWSDSHV